MPVEIDPAVRAAISDLHGADADWNVTAELLESPDGFSDAPIERLRVNWPNGVTSRYVLKRIGQERDWVAIASRDVRHREFVIAGSDILRRLPPGVSSAVIAAISLADGSFAVLSRDVSAQLAPPGDDPFTPTQLAIVMRGLARLHSMFAGFPVERAEQLALCRMEDYATLLSPGTTRRESPFVSDDHVTRWFQKGWDNVARIRPDVWTGLVPLLDDPGVVSSAADRCAQTLCHGDVKAGNLAFEGDNLVLLDWSVTGRWPGMVNIAQFLALNSAKLPVNREEVIDIYRTERRLLGRLPVEGEDWERERALASLVIAMDALCLKSLGLDSPDPSVRCRESSEFAFWCDAFLSGQRWLQ